MHVRTCEKSGLQTITNVVPACNMNVALCISVGVPKTGRIGEKVQVEVEAQRQRQGQGRTGRSQERHVCLVLGKGFHASMRRCNKGDELQRGGKHAICVHDGVGGVQAAGLCHVEDTFVYEQEGREECAFFSCLDVNWYEVFFNITR